MFNLSEVEYTKLSWKFRGLPEASLGLSIGEYLQNAPKFLTDGYQWPQAIMLDSALEKNLKTMDTFCKKHNVELAPHVKTHMSPQLAKRQIDNGAWGVTVANASQARTFLEFGFKKIIIANEVVNASSIKFLSEQDAEIYFYIDSLRGFEIVEENSTNPVNILLEIGKSQGRTGVRDLNLAHQLVDMIISSEKMNFAGVSGYEGTFGKDRSQQSIDKVRDFLKTLVAFAIGVQAKGPNPFMVSAGGSAFFDLVVDELEPIAKDSNFKVFLRSGGYVTHDHGFYAEVYPFVNDPEFSFLPALEVWSIVNSKPDSDLFIVNGGKRDISVDINLPYALKFQSEGGPIKELVGTVLNTNDQHLYLQTDNKELRVGDLVAFGISHPCTTFDKWPLIPVVSDDYQILDLYLTYF
jgi:D-serine deaminase-like pyridoxal phosphate-dependent protein